MNRKPPQRLRGFTLIELLVVIAIIAVLIGLLLPAVQKVRAAAARIKCQNNLKQLALAAHNYENSQVVLPPAASGVPSAAPLLIHLLPYVEQQALYQSFSLGSSVISAPANYYGRIVQVPTYLCPADPSSGACTDTGAFPTGVTAATAGAAGKTNYYGNAGTHGWWFEKTNTYTKPPDRTGVFGLNNQIRLMQITDGTSNTVMFAEIKRGANPASDALNITVLPLAQWGMTTSSDDPTPLAANFAPLPACDTPTLSVGETGLRYYRGDRAYCVVYTHTVPPNYTGRDCTIQNLSQLHLAARSYHTGGVNVAIADGSVRFISDTIPMDTWRALGTRSGGEVLSPE